MKTKSHSTTNEIIIDSIKTQKQIHENFFNYEKSFSTLTLSDAKSDYSSNDADLQKQDFPEANANSNTSAVGFSTSSNKCILEPSNNTSKSDESKTMNADSTSASRISGTAIPGNEKSFDEKKDDHVDNKNTSASNFREEVQLEKFSNKSAENEENNNKLSCDESLITKNDEDKSEITDATVTDESNQSELESWRVDISAKDVDLLTEEDLTEIYETFGEKVKSIPDENKEEWIKEMVKKHFGEAMPAPLMDIVVGECFEGDSGISMDLRPEWLDMDKFRRGQKFALDYLFGINYADLLSLFTVFSFKFGLKPLIFTGASSTPYTAFKRYASTGKRVYNWYKSDPWTKGTEAYNDIRTVRRLHAQVRKNLADISKEEYVDKTTIKDAWCPTLEISLRDFESTCPAAAPGQCPYMVFERCPKLRFCKLNQGEMIATQFAFVGLFILNPKFFGAHYATDEDLESFCHVWRGLGYLLGIEDRFNFCRGSLEDVRARSRAFLDAWVKPNLRTVNPEWEHMSRCVIEGLQYYFPGSTYEMCLLDLAEVMNLHMPRLYNSISYSLWIRRGLARFVFNQLCKLASFRDSFNKHLVRSLEKGNNLDENKHKQLQERSEKTLSTYKLESHNKTLKEKGPKASRYLTQLLEL